MKQRIVGLFALTTLAGCGMEASQEVETATESVTQALTTTSNTSDAAELANIFKGPGRFRFAAAEGFRCDDTPDITYVDVCGQSLPETVHLEWTDCAPPERPARGQGMDAGPGAPPPHHGQGDGGFPPPPPPPHGGHGGKGHGPRMGDGGMPPPPPPPPGRALARGHGPSSGVIDLTFSYATPNGCTGNIEQTQTSTFNIARTAEDGTVSRSEGTAGSVSELEADAKPLVKSTSIDVTHSVTDSAGTLVRSVDIVGTRNVAFSSDEPPTRTINSSYTETHDDGTTATMTEVDVVRPPMNVCPWPTSGTLTRTKADGTTHTVVYGPDCGDATLDGVAIDLAERRMEGRGGRRP